MSDVSTIELSDEDVIRKVSKEQRKVKMFNFWSIFSYLFIPLGLVVGFIIMYTGLIPGGPIILLAGIAFIPITIVINKKKMAIEAQLKRSLGEYIVKDVIAERIDIIKYTPDNFINEDFIKKCMILPKYDRISGSDYIKGTYRGVELVYSDLKLEREYKDTDSDGRTRTEYRTVFHGHLIKLELGQKIDGFVRIKERKTPRKEKGFLSDVLSGAADVLGVNTKDNTIEVENVEFNNQFEIKTNNQEMAFYILTPQFMENIIKLDQYAQGYTNIEFKANNVNITINNGRDSFEITKNMNSTKVLEKSRNQIRNDLNIVLSIIDEILEKDKLF